MTGKEALKLAQNTILAHNGQNKSSFTMKMLYQVEEALDKYKRAFEIINKHSKVDYIENTNINDLGKDYNLFICEINSIEDKEEYELLEELMKDAKD